MGYLSVDFVAEMIFLNLLIPLKCYVISTDMEINMAVKRKRRFSIEFSLPALIGCLAETVFETAIVFTNSWTRKLTNYKTSLPGSDVQTPSDLGYF